LPISTGLAFHPSTVQAIWRGLCEVIERDAVLSMWWIHRPLPKIDGDGAPHAVRERISRLTERGMTVHLFDITTELAIPTVFCVLESDRYPYFVVGAATRSSPAAACAKALDEVVSMRVAMHIQAASGTAGTSPGDEDSRPRSLVDHARWYASGNHNEGMSFLLNGNPLSVPYPQFAARAIADPRDMDSLTAIASHLEAQGVTALWIDLTSPDVASLGTVARVVVPELVPLSPDDHIRWLGTKRLQVRAGLPAATRYDFTDHPHPFA
jgi:ribosomal protein S12 methylthiotransferase accessory factor